MLLSPGYSDTATSIQIDLGNDYKISFTPNLSWRNSQKYSYRFNFDQFCHLIESDKIWRTIAALSVAAVCGHYKIALDNRHIANVKDIVLRFAWRESIGLHLLLHQKQNRNTGSNGSFEAANIWKILTLAITNTFHKCKYNKAATYDCCYFTYHMHCIVLYVTTLNNTKNIKFCI